MISSRPPGCTVRTSTTTSEGGVPDSAGECALGVDMMGGCQIRISWGPARVCGIGICGERREKRGICLLPGFSAAVRLTTA